MMKQLFLISLMTVLVAACGGRQSGVPDEATPIDSMTFKYARLIHVYHYDGYTLATVDNPWKPGMTLHRYVLIPVREAPEAPLSSPEGDTIVLSAGSIVSPSGDEGGASGTSGASGASGASGPSGTEYKTTENATLVRVPLQRSVIFTSVHAALVAELKAEEQVAGVADLKYIKVPFVQQGVADGRLVDCGEGMAPVIEKIIDAQADAILLSPFENSGGYGHLEDINIPLIECAEYMEASPLARAEWMRFYGLLYGCETRSDSLFAVVDSSYHALCRRAATSSTRRSVLVDKQTGSVWYVPGGHSTIGRMLGDARCDYPFGADSHSGSLSLPFEAVLEKAGGSDVWLLRYDSRVPLTLPQLLTEQPGYRQLSPVATGEVYGCNVMTSMFYEESPFRPDLLLQDFIRILHPDLADSLPPLRYYHRLGQ